MRDQSIRSMVPIMVLGCVLTASSIARADAIFLVNTVDDRIDDDLSDGICHTSANTCSLRAAFMQANKVTVPITRINVPAGTFVLTRPPTGANNDSNGDLNLTQPLVMGQRVIVTGAGAALSIDANEIHRVLTIATDRNVQITGMTLRNGNSAQYEGGGVINGGSLLLDSCIIEGNHAYEGLGGGIYSYGALQILRSTVRSNTAESGGGASISGFATISSSAFHDNSADSPRGGAYRGMAERYI